MELQFDTFIESSSEERIILLCLNGNGGEAISKISLLTYYSFDDLKKQVLSRLPHLNYEIFKIYNYMGIEIADDSDVLLLENQSRIYLAPKGEKFDPKGCLNAYEIIRTLGEGGFGTVVLAKDKLTGSEVAIKFLKLAQSMFADKIDRIYKEVESLEKLKHPSIVKLMNYFPDEDRRSIVLVMEYASGGELLDYLAKRKRLDENTAKDIFKQLVSAVQYCHKSKVVHRDLKLENILFESPESQRIMIIDFGISSGYRDDSSTDGSLKYMAPEALSNDTVEIEPSLDIWSLGVILYAMVMGTLPFTGSKKKEIYADIMQEEHRTSLKYKGQHLSMECKDLILKLLEPKESRRIIMEDIVSHPWILYNCTKYFDSEASYCDNDLSTENDLDASSCNSKASFIEREVTFTKDAEESLPIPPKPKTLRPLSSFNRASHSNSTQSPRFTSVSTPQNAYKSDKLNAAGSRDSSTESLKNGMQYSHSVGAHLKGQEYINSLGKYSPSLSNLNKGGPIANSHYGSGEEKPSMITSSPQITHRRPSVKLPQIDGNSSIANSNSENNFKELPRIGKPALNIMGHRNYTEEGLKKLYTMNTAFLSQVKESPSFQKPIGYTKFQKQQLSAMTAFNKHIKYVKSRTQSESSAPTADIKTFLRADSVKHTESIPSPSPLINKIISKSEKNSPCITPRLPQSPMVHSRKSSLVTDKSRKLMISASNSPVIHSNTIREMSAKNSIVPEFKTYTKESKSPMMRSDTRIKGKLVEGRRKSKFESEDESSSSNLNPEFFKWKDQKNTLMFSNISSPVAKKQAEVNEYGLSRRGQPSTFNLTESKRQQFFKKVNT